MNWARIFNRLFRIINSGGDAYFSGGRYLSAVREVDPDFEDYGQYIESRRSHGLSTSRKDYYYDILMSFEEPQRFRLIQVILREVEEVAATEVAEVRSLLQGGAAAPRAEVHQDLWNADRLNEMLENIDAAISATEFNRAVTLSYSGLEGFYKAFKRARVPHQQELSEIIRMARVIKEHLQSTLEGCPGEVTNMVTNITHAVDRSRNQFSDSHFDRDAGAWMAMYVRDLVNSQIRLLLNFL